MVMTPLRPLPMRRLASTALFAGKVLVIAALLAGSSTAAYACRGPLDFGLGDRKAKKQLEEGGGGHVSGPTNGSNTQGGNSGDTGSGNDDSDNVNNPVDPPAGNHPNQHGTTAPGGNGTGATGPCTPQHPLACKGAHPQ